MDGWRSHVDRTNSSPVGDYSACGPALRYPVPFYQSAMGHWRDLRRISSWTFTPWRNLASYEGVLVSSEYHAFVAYIRRYRAGALYVFVGYSSGYSVDAETGSQGHYSFAKWYYLTVGNGRSVSIFPVSWFCR